MGRSLFSQETQIHKSETFSDILGAGSTLESNSTCAQDDMNAIRSQLRKWMYQDAAGGGQHWYNDVPTITSIGAAKKRGIYDLAVNVDALEEHRILFRTQILTDIVVPAAVKAVGTLTLNSAPLNNETVVIGTTTYTFKAALTPANWEVLIEATASDSIDNLVWAINNTAGHPGKFQVPNAHPDVTAAPGAGDTMDVEAIVAGTKGNLIATTETLSDVLSVWGNPTLTTGAGDVVVLSVAGSEAPSEKGAVGAVTTKGAVVAYNSDFANWKLVKVTNVASPIQPKNLCIVRDATTGEVILSGDKEIYALLACEDPTDNQTFDDAGSQVELVFVKENGTGDDLVQVPGTDIGGKTINYSYVNRMDFDNLPETAFLSEVFIDQAGAVDVTRQHAYDNQGATPVDILLDAILDIEVVGKKWEIRDSLEASLFKITENSGTSATDISIGSDVDTLTVNSLANTFDKGVTVDAGGVDLQLGLTAIANTATIDTLATKDLRLMGTRELFLDDGNQAGSGWVQTSGIKLSDTTAEWTAFSAAFGEVSLLDAITQAAGAAARSKLTAVVSVADIPATTLIEGPGGPGVANISADLCDYRAVTFDTDVDVYINGSLQWNGAANDVYGSAVAAEQQFGCFYANFKLFRRGGTNPDVITMICWG